MNGESSVSKYDQDDYYSGDARGSRLMRTLNPLLDLLDRAKARSFSKRIKKQTGNALDVGAGDGKFLNGLKAQGFAVYGSTASEISKQAAKAVFGIDLEFSIGGIPDSLLVRKYDAITYWHVFEHLEQPELHVQQCAAVLAPGGTLLIEVPNIDSVGARLCFKAWLGSDEKHHINHMPRDRIREMLERHGFRIERTEGFSAKFTYCFLWSALLGFFFGVKTFHFDSVFDLLKKPVACLRARPFVSLIGYGSIFLFAPLILVLAGWEAVTGNGEVYRVWAFRGDRLLKAD